MKIEVSIDEMPKVCDFVIKEASQAGMGSKGISELRLVVEEAVANVVNYSGASDIMLGVTKQKGRLSMTLSDNGIPFDPTKVPSPDLTVPGEERPIGGLGIHFMREMSDGLTYRREGDKNILTIYKNF